MMRATLLVKGLVVLGIWSAAGASGYSLLFAQHRQNANHKNDHKNPPQPARNPNQQNNNQQQQQQNFVPAQNNTQGRVLPQFQGYLGGNNFQTPNAWNGWGNSFQSPLNNGVNA